MKINNKVKLLAVVGNPIKHSLSPIIHNYVLRKFDFNSIYTHFMLPKDISVNDFKNFIYYSDLSGVNITLPFKEIAFNAVDEINGIANDIQAINTIVKKDSKLIGYNTDADGFYKSIQHYKAKHILILGAGGSAKSIAMILKHNNIQISIANRSIDRLKFFESFGETMTFNELIKTKKCYYDIIVNATSTSINNELPLQKEILINLFDNCKLAYDLMYMQNNLTPFCRLASEKNIKFIDGKVMLVYQAALALLYFHEMKITDESLFKISNMMASALNIKL